MLLRALIACILLMLSGCQFAPQKSGLMEREAADAKLTARQLRTMVNEFVVLFADRIELAGDTILASTQDPAIRRNTLLWKINSISEAYQAASRHDPLGAYLDLWILSRQMTSMIDSELGEQWFGEWRTFVSRECWQLDKRLAGIQLALGSKTRFGEDFVAKFAADFPLSSLYFDREPIASRYIEEVREPVRDLSHVAVNLDENIDELRKLTVLFADHLPKQSRWEAELFLMDATRSPVIDAPLRSLEAAAQAVTSMANTVEQVPDLVERERTALHSIVTAERLATLEHIEAMRSDTLDQLREERKILLAAVTSEREAASSWISAERTAVTEELDTQLATALESVDAIAASRVAEFVRETPGVIDHLVGRIVQIAVTVLAGLLIAWVLRTTWRKSLPRPANRMPEPVELSVVRSTPRKRNSNPGSKAA